MIKQFYLVLFQLFFIVLTAGAQDKAAELSKEVANPLADIISLPFQNNLNGNYGPYNRNLNVLNIQPVIPLMGGKLITRTIFPIVSIPDFSQKQGNFSSGLSDIVFTAFVRRSFDSLKEVNNTLVRRLRSNHRSNFML
jgi:hypothetical protein